MRQRHRRLLMSPLAAVALAMLVAGQSLAASWTAPFKITTADTLDAMVTPGGSTAIVAFTRCVGGGFCLDEVTLRRSTNGGETWPHKYVLPGHNYGAALAGRGQRVDIVFLSEDDSGLYLRRSTNGGTSFGNRKLISDTFAEVEPSVARGPGGLVAICWGEWISVEKIACRVSTNGGDSFGSKTTFSTSDTEVSAVAAGDGAVYVAFLQGQDTIVVKKTVNGGSSWSTVLEVTDAEFVYSPSLTADGDEAFLAYQTVNANEHRQVRVRRTGNAGDSWSAPHLMAPDSVSPYEPRVALANGVVRGLFTTDDGVFYTQSPDGASWSSPKELTNRAFESFVGFAGHPLVTYQRPSFEIFSRTRQ